MRGALLLAVLVSLSGCGELLGIQELPGGDAAVDSTTDVAVSGDSSAADANDGGQLDAHDSGTLEASDGGPGPEGGGDSGSGGGTDAGCAGTTGCSCNPGGPGMTDCGPNKESCCTSLLVDGGTFLRSYDGVTFTDAGSPATVSAFRLDKYEVTVGRFRQFVEAVTHTGWLPPEGSGKHTELNDGGGLNVTSGGYEPGWDPADNPQIPTSPTVWNSNDNPPQGLQCDSTYQTWTPSAGANEDLPITCESWFEAYAFCIWDGGFLPSAAEWNFAAAGGGGSTGQRVYPWSVPSTNTAIDCAHANYDPSSPCLGGANAVGSESPAGDGAFGHADLAGNVWEWNLDAWANYVTPCVNCTYLTLGGLPLRFLRGGARDANAAELVVSATFGWDPALTESTFGVRCARAP
jgi:formylglycine-generating enzyme